MLAVTKFSRLVTYHKGLIPIMLLHPLITSSCEIICQTKTVITSSTAMSMARKRGRMVTYLSGPY